MTYSQPQQQYRPNRAALWVNTRKSAANQPDYKGNLEISYALVQELSAAFAAGQYVADGGGQPCIKLDLALYASQGGMSANGKAKPIMSGRLSTHAETQQSIAARQQAASQYAQNAPAPAHATPLAYGSPAPAQVAPAPMPVPQQPAPMPMPMPMPQQPAPVPVPPAGPVPAMPGAIHGQPLQPQPPALPQNF